jgi:hypothetical protein
LAEAVAAALREGISLPRRTHPSKRMTRTQLEKWLCDYMGIEVGTPGFGWRTIENEFRLQLRRKTDPQS